MVSDTERGHAYVQVLAHVLERLVEENDRQGIDTAQVTKFHALRAPSIGVRDYLERILKYASCSSECFILALIYIDRLIQRSQFVLTSLNVHRIIITSVMLAAKFFDDQYFNNAYYAKVGGVPCNEMNSLELEFLFSINFSVHVTTDTYRKYYAELCTHMDPPLVMQPIPPFAEEAQAEQARAIFGSVLAEQSSSSSTHAAGDVSHTTPVFSSPEHTVPMREAHVVGQAEAMMS